MSSQKIRTQYAFIEVEKSSDTGQTQSLCVSLSGPKEIVTSIYNSGIFKFPAARQYYIPVWSSHNLTLGNTSRLMLSTESPQSYNSTFMKAGLLEEILKHGFTPVSNITDDLVILTREVDIQ